MSDNLSREEIVAKYKRNVEPLMIFVPWLRQISGKQVESEYKGNGLEAHSMTFPVYDSNLMQFVKKAGDGELMTRNYQYVYSRHFLHTVEDEKKAIENATLTDIQVLDGIFSKYVLGGRVKAPLWNEGVTQGIFLRIMEKYIEILTFYDSEGFKQK